MDSGGGWTGAVLVNPIDIENKLAAAGFRYPRNSEAYQYKGFSKTPVIPTCYSWLVENQRFPHAEEGVEFILSLQDSGFKPNDKLLIGRARKLYMDFAFDMHTLGLLLVSQEFAFVEYQKTLDVSFNIDFVVSLLESDELAGVQSARRWDWPDNPDDDFWNQQKARRRRSRGKKEWIGEFFWMTNAHRPIAKTISGCWLFGRSHVLDLVKEIKEKYLEELEQQEMVCLT